jgi:hypothetical protein
VAVVERWLDAVNEQDVEGVEGVEGVEALTSEQVEIVGPRGQGMMDRSVLGEWLSRSRFISRPLRWFCGADGMVVVEQEGTWHDVATGQRQGRLFIGSEFVVRHGQVVRYVRHDIGVDAALAASGLDEQRGLVTYRR